MTPSSLRLAALAVAVALVVALVWGRAVVASHSAWSAGVDAQAEGDVPSAILHYRHAVQWHAPLGSRCGEALDALVAVGDAAAAAGDLDTALFAWRSARAGVMSTRHLWTPHAAELPELHERIGAAMAVQVAGDDAPDPDTAAGYTAQLDDWRSRSPNPWLAAGASVGFLAWLLALGMLAWRGISPEGRVVRASFARWAVIAAVAFVAWVTMVRLA